MMIWLFLQFSHDCCCQVGQDKAKTNKKASLLLFNDEIKNRVCAYVYVWIDGYTCFCCESLSDAKGARMSCFMATDQLKREKKEVLVSLRARAAEAQRRK
jgi:hypothetical protein